VRLVLSRPSVRTSIAVIALRVGVFNVLRPQVFIAVPERDAIVLSRAKAEGVLPQQLLY
jgi:hypothetical protein